MKRKLKWLAIVLAVSLLGFGTAIFLWPRDRITPESWKKIQIGMTESEVEKLLDKAGISFNEHQREQEGPRPSHHFNPASALMIEGATEHKGHGNIFGVMLPLDDKKRTKYWVGQAGIIGIHFDHEKVVWKLFQGGRLAEVGVRDEGSSSFLYKLRRFFGW
ncbi:MAG TPA: hypothetical protein VKE98_12945 [Gemmataceae bacterium]|nr:hypothetical protein [Gemmataceae bacterium]